MGPAVPLSQPGAGGQMLPTVALANNGQAVAAWQRGLGNTGIVEGAAFSAGGAAGPATQLSQPARGFPTSPATRRATRWSRGVRRLTAAPA